MAQFEQLVPCTREMIWERVLSKSYVASLDQSEQQQLRQKILAVLEEEFGPEQEGEVIDYPYSTDVVWCRARK